MQAIEVVPGGYLQEETRQDIAGEVQRSECSLDESVVWIQRTVSYFLI